MKVIASVFGVLCIVALSVIAQQPEIVGFARDGNLTFNSASEGKDYRLEFAPNANGPWQASLIDAPITGAVMTATTPQYFRVVEAESRQINPCVENWLISFGLDWNGNGILDGEEINAIEDFNQFYNGNGKHFFCFCNPIGDLRGLTSLRVSQTYLFPLGRDSDYLLPASVEELAHNPITRSDLVLTNLPNLGTVYLTLQAGSTVDLTGLDQEIGGEVNGGGASLVYVTSTTNFTGLSLYNGAAFVVK